MHPDNHSVQRQVEWQSLRIRTRRIAAIAKQGPRVSTISAPLAAPDHVNCAVQTRRAHPHLEPSPERQPKFMAPRRHLFLAAASLWRARGNLAKDSDAISRPSRTLRA